MPRKEMWPDRLMEEVNFQSSTPFKWGVSDCLIFAMHCVEAMTGKSPMRETDYDYADKKGALRMLKKRGYRSVGDAIAKNFEEIPVALAGRGDLGLVEGDGYDVVVVFVGPTAVGKDENGVNHIPRSSVQRAFRVE